MVNSYYSQFFSLFLTLVLIASCNTSINSRQEFYDYLNNSQNGFVKSKEVNSFRIKVKYLPIEYLIIKNSEHSSEVEKVRQEYNNSLTFVFTIESIDKDQNVIDYGMSDSKSLNERFKYLNFHLDDHITLSINDQWFKPVLFHVENTGELNGEFRAYVVFSDIDMEADNLYFLFEDTFFDTGISQFVFEKQHLNQLPDINFDSYDL